MNIQRTPTVSVNGREYKFPKAPTVAVCIDGSEPGYIERAIEAGLTFRALEDTVRDTLEHAELVDGVGLAPEREAELLAAAQE